MLLLLLLLTCTTTGTRVSTLLSPPLKERRHQQTGGATPGAEEALHDMRFPVLYTRDRYGYSSLLYDRYVS